MGCICSESRDFLGNEIYTDVDNRKSKIKLLKSRTINSKQNKNHSNISDNYQNKYNYSTAVKDTFPNRIYLDTNFSNYNNNTHNEFNNESNNKIYEKTFSNSFNNNGCKRVISKLSQERVEDLFKGDDEEDEKKYSRYSNNENGNNSRGAFFYGNFDMNLNSFRISNDLYRNNSLNSNNNNNGGFFYDNDNQNQEGRFSSEMFYNNKRKLIL